MINIGKGIMKIKGLLRKDNYVIKLMIQNK